ncbi:S-layer homology domain-containing protein [Paenibacillus alkalitolerans]|uniref:S-layer homology domain-containing protein n=1 Tax=Paenibacillus alkalitolerans TaxID=2799335 RepID=UPI001F2BEFE2|nr:S-layer homology domain-containing protein [Paenibacillus alkalitolerans]
MKIAYRIYILLLAIVLSFSTIMPNVPAGAVNSLPFHDISNSFAKDAIIHLYQKQIVDGTGDKLFEPRKPISRAEFAAMLMRLFKLQPTYNAVPAFSDVPKSSWYYGQVHAAVNLGIVTGTSPNTFEPGKSITRQEAAALLARALKHENGRVDGISLPFSDAGSVSEWAVPLVDAAYSLGLIQGYNGKIRPHDPISRQEAAVVFDRILQNAAWSKRIETEYASGIQLGWLYNQSNEQFKKSIEASVINTISPRWFFLKAPDQITDSADASLVKWAHQNNKKVWPLVGNRFDKQLTHQFLTKKELRDVLISRLTEFVRKYDLDGLNIDFEQLDPADKDAYTAFIADLAGQLHKEGAVLSVCVPPDLGNDWSMPFDYAALGKSADYIVLMGYDEHWSGSGKAGSVSSLPWLRKHLEKLTKQVPAEKVIAGLPFYTKDWAEANGKIVSEDVTLLQQNSLMESRKPEVQWDDSAGQYVASYKSQGVRHHIWAEDSRSLTLKFQAGVSLGVAGNAYWYIGSESPDVWASLRNGIKYANYYFSKP